jgi:hypothetical protein
MTTTTTRQTQGLRLALLLGLASCATTTEATRAPKDAEREAMAALGAKAPGTIVWTSARAGLPHIFAMRTDGSDLRQLTKGAFTDWHPRLSPDGKKVLFSRSRDEGLVRESQANADGAWDLFVVGADGKGIGKEVENATWGSWIANDEVLFQRGAQILRTKLGSDDETLVLDTASTSLGGSTIAGATLSPSGHLLALSLGGARPQVGIWHLKKAFLSPVGSGSQIEWAPDGKSVYWVSPTGRGFAELSRVRVEHGVPVVDKPGATRDEPAGTAEKDEKDEPAGKDEKAGPGAAEGDDQGGPTPKDPTRLLDVPSKRSHEFFPRLSNDGKWLVFGAARGGGAHDVEDFEIYLWQVGAPVKSSVRMTFDAANDRWPDLFVEGASAASGGETKPSEEAPEKESTAAATDRPKADEGAGEDKDKGAQTEKTEATEGGAEAGPATKAADDAGDEFATPAPAKGKARPKAKGKPKKKPAR